MSSGRPVLLSVENISKSYGARPLFEGVTFGIFDGDRIGLVGPNGSGKSTLMRILAALETPDSGSRIARRGLRVGYVPQDPTFDPEATCEEVLLEAIVEDEAHHLEPYEREALAAVTLGKAGFTDREQKVSVLSGGWRKRLSIAQQLIRQPDVLLMDEPTNHLDLEGIEWLEALLAAESLAYLVVSHDRYFLERIASRMIELSRVYPRGVFEVDGNYSDFLVKRDELLANQAAYEDSLANLVRREIEWLRRGPKARTTKAKARIQNANELIDTLDEARSRNVRSSLSIDFTASERKTKRLWFGRGLTKSFGPRTIFRNLDVLLSPGSRVGVLGPNGSGKTTLLRVVTGELEPDAGTIERADGLRVVYFEQNRESLDPDIPLKRALAPEGDSVIFRDRSLHVASWAKRFLFRPEQLETAVSRLSGGERARIMIARLMLQPADLLILDEPTNDLDIPTLDVLEESLLDFPGALLLVTHDRYLLDRVSTTILALDGNGRAEYYADYDQWLTEEKERESAARKIEAKKTEAPKAPPAQKKRLSYNEQREWDTIEQRVADAEAKLMKCETEANDPSIMANAAELQRRYAALADAKAAVDALYARWAELEEKLS